MMIIASYIQFQRNKIGGVDSLKDRGNEGSFDAFIDILFWGCKVLDYT